MRAESSDYIDNLNNTVESRYHTVQYNTMSHSNYIYNDKSYA